MNQNKKAFKLQEAVENSDPRIAGKLIVEIVLDADEDIAEIAADFIENEVGRLDWVNNWRVIKAREDVLAKVQSYLATYGLTVDAQEVINTVDRMAKENPGRVEIICKHLCLVPIHAQ